MIGRSCWSYGVGYWVTNPQQGKGFASESLVVVLEHAAALGATDAFAGVDHGNAARPAVLEKWGFVKVADLDTCTRFHPRTDPSG